LRPGGTKLFSVGGGIVQIARINREAMGCPLEFQQTLSRNIEAVL